MADRGPQSKQDEQYPLLKVDTGGGDNSQPQPTANIVSPRSSVAYSSKLSWLVRWPEYMSACWMTVILLGISFLVFYAMGMSAYKHHSVIVIKCNSSKPASDVYFHHIIQTSGCVPFMLYSEYLSYMAIQYPFLNFNVYFLIDDSVQSSIRSPRHRFINKLIPYHPSSILDIKLDVINRQQIRDFQRKYQNVNISITPLSKYMAMTPLKFKWRTIPISYLPFYARIYSVWQNGGIGLDLTTFNNKFNTRQSIDRRIMEILKQHNDGIKPGVYANTFGNMDRVEENEFFSFLCGVVQQFLNETRSFFNKTLAFPQVTTDKSSPLYETLIRTHRNKREVTNDTSNNNNNLTISVDFVNVTGENLTDYLKKNEYDIVLPSTEKYINNSSKAVLTPSLNNSLDKTKNMNVSLSRDRGSNITDAPEVVFFYDFTMFFDSLEPSFSWPEKILQTNIRESIKKSEISSSSKRAAVQPQLLSIDPEGLFVSVSSRLHPFLAHLISAGSQRMHPKLAIQDVVFTQCSSIIFRNDVYCNNIYIL